MRKRLVRQALETAYALIIVFPVWNWAVQYAYEFRGYRAAGGEYIFILAVYPAAYRIAVYVVDGLEYLVSKARQTYSVWRKKGGTGKAYREQGSCCVHVTVDNRCRNEDSGWQSEDSGWQNEDSGWQNLIQMEKYRKQDTVQNEPYQEETGDGHNLMEIGQCGQKIIDWQDIVKNKENRKR